MGKTETVTALTDLSSYWYIRMRYQHWYSVMHRLHSHLRIQRMDIDVCVDIHVYLYFKL